MPIPVSNPIMDLVLLGALFGGRGGFGGGHHRGGRYYREVVVPPTEAEALTVPELEDAESLPIMTDSEVVVPTTHDVHKRQLPLGAAVSPFAGVGAPLAGVGAPLAAPVPVPVAGGFGLGMTGSPILDLILLSSLFGGNGRRHRRDIDQPEAEELISETEALNVDTPVGDIANRVKRQLVPPIGGGILAPMGAMGGSPIINLLLLQSLYGNGGIFGSNGGNGGNDEGRRGKRRH